MLKVSCQQDLNQSKKAGALFLPFIHKNKKPVYAGSIPFPDSLNIAFPPLDDFSGKLGQVAVIYPNSGSYQRLFLVGFGSVSDLTYRKVLELFYQINQECSKRLIQNISFISPNPELFDSPNVLRWCAEGPHISNYRYDQLKSVSVKSLPSRLARWSWIGMNKDFKKHVTAIKHTANGITLTKDLVNGNADEVSPRYMQTLARRISTNATFKTTILGPKGLEKEGMKLMLAVARGSSYEPALIVIEYMGKPSSKDNTVLVGKGVTFDTGGLNMKRGASMSTMKSDIAGGAAVLGVMSAIAKLQMKANIISIIPVVENSIDSLSYKPGDVYKSRNGITVEIGDTDAEGRLLLADTFDYAIDKYKPSRIIDIATLTDETISFFGHDIASCFSNNNQLLNAFQKASKTTGELIWPLPISPIYRKYLSSHVADIKSTSDNIAPTITASSFLEVFVKDTPWIHLDIAGTAFIPHSEDTMRYGSTAFGVRLILEALKQLPH